MAHTSNDLWFLIRFYELEFQIIVVVLIFLFYKQHKVIILV